MPSACQSATEIGSIRLQGVSGRMTVGSLRDGSIGLRLGFVDRSRHRIGCLLVMSPLPNTSLTASLSLSNTSSSSRVHECHAVRKHSINGATATSIQLQLV